MARMKANRERAADLRVHAWRVTIASGTDRTIHNQVLLIASDDLRWDPSSGAPSI
jgi:hypothetical protein